MTRGEGELRHSVRVSAPGDVAEGDVGSLEAWLRGEPELRDRAQVKRGARPAEAGALMGPQLDIVIEWVGAATTTEIVRLVTASIKEWVRSRQALGDDSPPGFRAEPDDQRNDQRSDRPDDERNDERD
ncbi:effector-associated constant component EACC1 [Streptomyces sp. NPDC000405]|uniref:effector-associated constant component EACC1 n=1 Tax=Streptomyces sp. NPDC000405 TaxID=3161033 RepID=UPI00398D3856